MILDGVTSMATVTLLVKPVKTGPQHCINVGKKIPFLLISLYYKAD